MIGWVPPRSNVDSLSEYEKESGTGDVTNKDLMARCHRYSRSMCRELIACDVLMNLLCRIRVCGNCE